MADTEHGPLIAEVRAAVETNSTGARRERLLARLRDLENAHGTPTFGDHIKALVAEAEEETGEVAPFLSRLSSLLP